MYMSNNLSMFFAQVLGVYVFLVSLTMLIHATRFKKTMHEFVSDGPLMAFAGGISLLIGLAIVVSHNVWVADWPLVITLIGWLMIIQGVMRILFPESMAKLMKDLMASTAFTLLSWVWLLVGIYLVWVGFAS